MAFGFTIKKLREEKGITSAEMSDILGIDSVERYRNWEKRDGTPKSGDVKKIELVFNLPFEQILKLKSLPKEFGNKKFNDIQQPIVKTEEELSQMAIVDILIEEVAKLKSEKEKRPMIEVLKELNESANLRAVQLSKHLAS